MALNDTLSHAIEVIVEVDTGTVHPHAIEEDIQETKKYEQLLEVVSGATAASSPSKDASVHSRKSHTQILPQVIPVS